jgi:hypothetical protein
VTSLTVTFDAAVVLPADPTMAFTLTRTGGGAVGGFTATVGLAGGRTVVTLGDFTGANTQFGSLADGRYTLTVLSSQIGDPFGQALDGDGDGTPGGDGTTAFHRLFGDATGDARVDVADLGLFAGTYLKASPDSGYLAYFDFNNDGRVDVADLGQFAGRYLVTLP